MGWDAEDSRIPRAAIGFPAQEICGTFARFCDIMW
jgi:hypothetical protein